MTKTIDIRDLGLFKDQIIILSVAGSHMYGMNTPKSDNDFLGVYLPTFDQLMLNNFPKQVSLPKDSGVDLQIWSLHYFLKLACAGETMALDLLHAPEYCWLETNGNIWLDLVNSRKKFFTKNMSAFVSYARKQAAKYGLKGDRMKTIENVLTFLHTCGNNTKLKDIWDHLPTWEHTHFLDTKPYRMYQVCGKKFLETVKCTYLIEHLQKELTSYGKRAIEAKENKGVDWKAISHAFRTTQQVYEILTKGDYKYPLADSEFFTEIKLGKCDFTTVVQPKLDSLISEVEKLIEESDLPDHVNQYNWDAWLIEIIKEHVL